MTQLVLTHFNGCVDQCLGYFEIPFQLVLAHHFGCYILGILTEAKATDGIKQMSLM